MKGPNGFRTFKENAALGKALEKKKGKSSLRSVSSADDVAKMRPHGKTMYKGNTNSEGGIPFGKKPK